MPGERNWGYFKGYQNIGDGTNQWRGSHPPTNLANEYTEQYLTDQGALRIGRITEVYAASKVVEINTGEGSLPAVWGGDISTLNGAGAVGCPCPGDHALIWKPVNGMPVVVCRIPAIGEAEAINFDINHSDIDAYSETRHSFHLRPGQFFLPYYNMGRPVDVLPGDWAQIDSMGAAVALLQGVALLKASPLAQIQCSVLDDLVRVCARTYQLWNAGGETRIFNDEGEINYEFLLTHKGPEALGETEEGTDISQPNSDDEKLFQELSDPEKKAIDRIQIDVGHNGDIVHMWVKKPQPDASNPVGLAHIRIGSDGAMTVETTKEIVIGKTDKILTPKRSKEPWDKDGDSLDAGYTPDVNQTDDFTWDDSHADGKALQDRDQRIYNKQREIRKYKDHEKDYDQIIEEVPEAEDGEEDYMETTAYIHLRSDGSIYLQDEAESTVELTATGDVRLACSKDFLVEAGRDFTVFAGRNLNVRSRKHAELSSTEEDIRVKAEGAALVYTKKKGILLETASEALPNGEKGADQESGGITLRSKETAPILLRSEKDKVVLHSEKDIDCKVDDESSEFYVEAPTVFLNLVGGAQRFLVTCRDIVQNVTNVIHQRATALLQKLSGGWINDSSLFAISGRAAGRIHAPGGVDVAHIHPTSEFSYAADAHGEKAVQITKLNAAVPANPDEPDPTTFEEEVDPHTPSTMEQFKFNYLTDYELDGCFWYETVWQKRFEDGETWDLTQDTIDGTEAYPGFAFSSRVTYSDVNMPGDDDPDNSAGSFPGSSKTSYKVGKQDCEGAGGQPAITTI